MHGVRPADQDRLPWLEPYREAKTAAGPAPRPGSRQPLALGAMLALLLAVGAGGYWLGQRGEPAAPTASAPSATVALPAPKPQPQSQPTRVAEAGPTAADSVVPEPPAIEKAAPARKAAKRRAPPRKKKIRSAGVERREIDAVRTAQERQALSRPWPKMPSPGPAGQVIQLGAFSTPARANAAYYQRISRYKALAAMPRVVVPVVTKPDGRILYVLRLGTTSRQHSKTICRNLRDSGDHCLVIG